jgi:surface protein
VGKHFISLNFIWLFYLILILFFLAGCFCKSFDLSHFNSAWRSSKLPWGSSQNVVTMNSMFYGATSFSCSDLTGWDTSKVTDMGLMFGYTTGFNGDISTWNTVAALTMTLMFRDSVSLVSVRCNASNCWEPRAYTFNSHSTVL